MIAQFVQLERDEIFVDVRFTQISTFSWSYLNHGGHSDISFFTASFYELNMPYVITDC